jgi:zinc/manganese transport system substrate-binding protein
MRMILDMVIFKNSTVANTALAACVAVVVALAGCGGSADDGRLQVTATTTQVADLVRNIAGDRADVHGILAPNSDPHEYEPRPSDAAALADADVIFRSGGDLDLWLDQIVESSGSDAPVVSLIDATATIDAPDGETDPHWWQDPRNAIAAVEAIRDELAKVDPGGTAIYDANAEDYIGKLRTLDREIAQCIERVPADERKLVTSHDALGYYAHRYGIDVIGAAIPATTTQAQASAGETADLIDLIDREGVRAIFPEAGVSEKLEDAIASQSGATVGGQLWADALGPVGSSGATYVEALAANTRTLVDGLTGGEQQCSIEVAD